MSTPKIGRYKVKDELGQGGMATVYLAHDPYTRRQVAIKVLTYQFTTDPLFQEHFQREAEVIASLEHPCIVPIFDFGWQGDQPYIVMRYMAGGSFQDLLDKKKVGLHQLSRVIDRVAEGLDAAHAQGVVHRDVKPYNILFDDSDQAFLSDFGLAKLLDKSTGKTSGLFVGTPEYMSPEQVRNERLDGRSDVYALGIVLYCALVGSPPYENESPLATAVAHVTEPAPNILDARSDLHASWHEIVSKALAKDPADRYATAGELARDVREVVSGRWYLRKLADG